MTKHRVSTGKVRPVEGQLELPLSGERDPDHRKPEEIVICGHKQAPWLPPCGCS